MTALEGKALLDHGRAIAKRYARCVGPDLAEELRAEAVLRALGSPPPDGRLRPWLERIYRNLLIDRWRRPLPRMVDLAEVPSLASTGTPEDTLLCHERRRLVRASLAGLPREMRRVLLARYYGQLDDKIAASRLGIAATTIRTRVHRVLARLRLRLADLRAFFPPILGKLGTPAVAVGMAPMLVATLVVVGSASPPAHDQEIGTPGSLSQPAAQLPPQPRPTTESPLPPQVPRMPVRTARRSAASHRASVPTPAAATPPALSEDEPVIYEILHPDVIDVLAAPDSPAVRCMIEAPPSFLASIERMVEDLP